MKMTCSVINITWATGGENVINSSVLTEKDKRKQPTPTSIVPKPSANAGLFDEDDALFGTVPTQSSGM